MIPESCSAVLRLLSLPTAEAALTDSPNEDAMIQESRSAVLRLLAGLPSQYRRHRSAAAVQKKVTSVPREVSSAKASRSTSSANAPSLHTAQLSNLWGLPARLLVVRMHARDAAGSLFDITHV